MTTKERQENVSPYPGFNKYWGESAKKIIGGVTAAILFLTAAAGCAQAKPAAAEQVSPAAATANAAPERSELVLFHTNDMHGRIAGDEEAVIGIERIAAIHKSVPDSVLLDAGDTLHGLPIATLNQGADIIALMNEAGYDAMVIGNHDFNYGWERILKLSDMADFPVLSANVTHSGVELLHSETTINKNGVKIGVFGITTEETAGSAMPEYTSGLTFEDPVGIAKEKAQALRGKGADVIVALCHLGSEPCRGTISTQLAREVPDIDVIIDGHSHTALPQGLTENGVLIAQAGYHGNNVGKIEIVLENGMIISKTASLIDFEQARDTPPDEAAANKLSEITQGLSEVLKESAGESGIKMTSGRAPGVRTQEAPLGNFIADAYRAAAEAEIAVVNGGDIRADIVPGLITKGDVISILPFGNTLMVKNVTPALLRQALENGVSGIIVDENGQILHEESAQGRFLHVSGFSFAYDPAAPVGQRVVSITLDNGTSLPLDDDQTQISLAASNYVLTGGDGYDMLAKLDTERELGAADEALTAYISKNSPVTEPDIGRITVY